MGRTAVANGQPTWQQEFDQIVAVLVNDISWLRYMWAAYNELYMTQESLDVINETAPQAFNLYRFALQREIMMAICRLCDRERSGRQPTRRSLALETLVNKVRASGRCSERACARLQNDLKAIRKRAQPLRMHRNKRLAHTDVVDRLTQPQDFLDGVTPGLIGQLILHITTLVDLTREQLSPGLCCSWGSTSGAQHAGRLVQALRDAVEHAQSRPPSDGQDVEDWPRGEALGSHILAAPKHDQTPDTLPCRQCGAQQVAAGCGLDSLEHRGASMSRPSRSPEQLTTPQRLGAIVRSARDIMRKDKGLNGDLDRLPMLTWVMFLKFLDDMEQLRQAEAALRGERFRPALDPPYRWRDWAADEAGITGDVLIAFVNNDEALRPDGSRGPGLFAYLRGLQGENGHGRRDVIATVFKGAVNRMQSGYLLRDVINKVNGIHFTSTDEIHTLSAPYESMLKEMRDAAGDSGEFYTPGPSSASWSK